MTKENSIRAEVRKHDDETEGIVKGLYYVELFYNGHSIVDDCICGLEKNRAELICSRINNEPVKRIEKKIEEMIKEVEFAQKQDFTYHGEKCYAVDKLEQLKSYITKGEE